MVRSEVPVSSARAETLRGCVGDVLEDEHGVQRLMLGMRCCRRVGPQQLANGGNVRPAGAKAATRSTGAVQSAEPFQALDDLPDACAADSQGVA
jgi:hypothetical protein